MPELPAAEREREKLREFLHMRLGYVGGGPEYFDEVLTRAFADPAPVEHSHSWQEIGTCVECDAAASLRMQAEAATRTQTDPTAERADASVTATSLCGEAGSASTGSEPWPASQTRTQAVGQPMRLTEAFSVLCRAAEVQGDEVPERWAKLIVLAARRAGSIDEEQAVIDAVESSLPHSQRRTQAEGEPTARDALRFIGENVCSMSEGEIIGCCERGLAGVTQDLFDATNPRERELERFIGRLVEGIARQDCPVCEGHGEAPPDGEVCWCVEAALEVRKAWRADRNARAALDAAEQASVTRGQLQAVIDVLMLQDAPSLAATMLCDLRDAAGQAEGEPTGTGDAPDLMKALKASLALRVSQSPVRQDMVEITFTATVRLDRNADILETDAEGDVEQAIQTLIGHTGAQVQWAEVSRYG